MEKIRYNENMESLKTAVVENALFLNLRNVVENNAYHDHQPVYDHLLLTYSKAEKEISGDSINNPEAIEQFEKFLDEEVGGVKKRDLLPIITLTHDIGKMLSYEEDGKTFPIVKSNADGTTSAPGHEFAGSTIASDVLAQTNLPVEAIDYVAKGIRLHGIFNDIYQANKNASSDEILEMMVQKSEGMQFEMIFCSLCDNYTAEPFKEALPKISEMLNNPKTYSSRKFFTK